MEKNIRNEKHKEQHQKCNDNNNMITALRKFLKQKSLDNIIYSS